MRGGGRKKRNKNQWKGRIGGGSRRKGKNSGNGGRKGFGNLDTKEEAGKWRKREEKIKRGKRRACN